MSAAERAEKLAELDSIKDQAIGPEVALPRLLELLSDDDDEVRAQAATAAASYPAADDVAARLLELARDASERVRSAAFEGLGSVIRAGDLAGAGLAGYAPDPDLDEPSAERFAAARSLLLEALEREQGELRRRAVLALAFLGDEPAVVAATEALAGEEDEASRVAALRAMGRSGHPRWAARVREVVEEQDAGPVGEAAIRAAGASEVVDLAPLLGRILKGQRQPAPLRLAAAEALASLGKDAAPTLLEVTEDGDEDEAVREAARAGLERLTLLRDTSGAEHEEVEA